jgi:hypothetical protein
LIDVFKNYNGYTTSGNSENTESDDPDLIDINNYIFENEKNLVTSAETVKPKENTNPNKKELLNNVLKQQKSDTIPFVLPNTFAYNTNFFVDYVVSNVNNNFFNENYQRFTGTAPGFIQPNLNLAMKLSSSDLFEDKRIFGAAGLSFNLRSNEAMIGWEERSKRIDHLFAFNRQSLRDVRDFTINQVVVHQLKYSAKYPVSEVAAFKFTANMRYDRVNALAVSFAELLRQPENDYFANFKGEYIFDNTLTGGLNFLFGTRLKVFAESFRQIDDDGYQTYTAGFDIRHYQKIHRDFIWANRLAYGTSFGPEKLVYYLGGIDNMIFPVQGFDASTAISSNQRYIFQTTATNVRGFLVNIRNGTSFAVANSELRFPFFRYIANKPLKSDFLNTFQMIGFGDLGMAWTGSSPFADNNENNLRTINANPITITLKNQNEPLIGGYGFGLRARLFGYFMRFDWAWGVENYRVQPRVFYFSLNLDF